MLRKIFLVIVMGLSCFKLSLAESQPEEPVLNLYCWVDNIPKELIEKFTAETGIKVVYTPFDNNEVLSALLLTGSSAYDVVCPSAWPYAEPQIAAGLYLALDFSKLPNARYLDPFLVEKLKEIDPDNKFIIPYSWGVTGIGYNKNLIKQHMADAPLHSLKMLFVPEVVSKFQKCGVALLEEAVDVIPLALLYLGYDPNSHHPEEMEKAGKLLKTIRPFVSKFGSYRSASDLANGELCLVQGWSSEIYRAQILAEAAGNNIKIEFTIPEEGGGMWADVYAIPTAAPHPDNAHKFINFMLRKENAAQLCNYIATAPTVITALPLIDKRLRENPIIFPPERVRKKLFVDKSMPRDYIRARSRLWMQIKANRAH